jgi:hypothetical protein
LLLPTSFRNAASCLTPCTVISVEPGFDMRADKTEREKEDSRSVRNSASLEYELDGGENRYDFPVCGRRLCIPKTSSGCDTARELFKLVG